jgi:hypothetical protein
MPSQQKQFYYHISNTKLHRSKSGEVTLTPRDYGDNRAQEEPDDARICVAPSVPHCLIALGTLAIDNGDSLFIYRTKNKVVGKPPYGVTDSHITKERWLTRQTKFVLTSKVSVSDRLINVMCKLGCVGSVGCLKQQSRALKKLEQHRELYS